MCCLRFKSQPCLHPNGDIVGEGFTSQDQGHTEDPVAPSDAETEMWSPCNVLCVQFDLHGLLRW